MSQQDDLTQSQDLRPVTQEDREATWAYFLYSRSMKPDDYRAVKWREQLDRGERDTSEIVQAFAHHRIAALSRQEASGEVRAALADLVKLWDHFTENGTGWGNHEEAYHAFAKGHSDVWERAKALSAQPLADAGDVEQDWNALAERVVAAANIVSHDGYYELDIDAVARTLSTALSGSDDNNFNTKEGK